MIAEGIGQVRRYRLNGPSPVLAILGAERDTVSPPADAEAIAQAGRGRLVMVPGATHNGLWRDETTRRLGEAALQEWFRRLA